MRSLPSQDITTPVAFQETCCGRRFQLWNRQALIITNLTALARSHPTALPSPHMSTEEVLKALERYTEESGESDHETATKLGVKGRTLTGWLSGRDRPQRSMLARLAGFLRRVGYL
jgi:hypothetical protein